MTGQKRHFVGTFDSASEIGTSKSDGIDCASIVAAAEGICVDGALPLLITGMSAEAVAFVPRRLVLVVMVVVVLDADADAVVVAVPGMKFFPFGISKWS